MLSERGHDRLMKTHSSSFACDLRKWREIMHAYETGGHAYHTTMPTDALRTFRDVMLETEVYGFDKVMAERESVMADLDGLAKSQDGPPT